MFNTTGMSDLKPELGDGNKLNYSTFHAIVTTFYISTDLRQQRYLTFCMIRGSFFIVCT